METAKKAAQSSIKNSLEAINSEIVCEENLRLVGSSGVVDSMGLVQICLDLEDQAGELGFEFDWTSDQAMSRSKGMFQSVETLANEFAQQYASQLVQDQ